MQRTSNWLLRSTITPRTQKMDLRYVCEQLSENLFAVYSFTNRM